MAEPEDTNLQLVVTYKTPRGDEVVYATAYDDKQAVRHVRDCVERYGALRTEVRARDSDNVWKGD